MYLPGIGPGYRRDKNPILAGRFRIGTDYHYLRLGWSQLIMRRGAAVTGGDEHVIAVLHALRQKIRLRLRIGRSLAAGERHQLFLSYCWTDLRPWTRNSHSPDSQIEWSCKRNPPWPHDRAQGCRCGIFFKHVSGSQSLLIRGTRASE